MSDTPLFDQTVEDTKRKRRHVAEAVSDQTQSSEDMVDIAMRALGWKRPAKQSDHALAGPKK
jgi:hypothetical protein